MAGNGNLSLEQAVELILANDTEEFLSYFPQYTEYMNKIKIAIEEGFATAKLVNEVVREWKLTNTIEDPKAARAEFAKFVKGKSFTPLFFVAYDDRDVIDYVKSLNAKKLINFFKLYDYE